MTCERHRAQIDRWAEHNFGPRRGWLNRGRPELSVEIFNRIGADRHALRLEQIKGIRDNCAKGMGCTDE